MDAPETHCSDVPEGPTRIIIHTDGSCLGNPGPGGWACILQRFAGGTCITDRELSGGAPDTTNNRMELMACLRALQQVRRDETAPITLRSDSRYLIDGITKNLPNWKARGWKLSDGKPVKNPDLWEKIDTQLAQLPPISFEWVRGHSGDRLNERVDTLAGEAAFADHSISNLCGAQDRQQRVEG